MMMLGDDTPNADEGPERYVRANPHDPRPETPGAVMWTHTAPRITGMAPITVHTDDGRLLFAFNGDGTIDVPDPDRIPEAAAIFWRDVTKFAQLCGFRVNWFQEGEPK